MDKMLPHSMNTLTGLIQYNVILRLDSSQVFFLLFYLNAMGDIQTFLLQHQQQKQWINKYPELEKLNSFL